MHLIQDEFQMSAASRLSWQRLRSRVLFVTGLGASWAIGERFDERFDTEVGGTVLLATQYIDEDSKFAGGLSLPTDLKALAETPKANRPAVIIDHQCDGKVITLEEAEGRPECQVVLARLKERMAEYAALTNWHDN